MHFVGLWIIFGIVSAAIIYAGPITVENKDQIFSLIVMSPVLVFMSVGAFAHFAILTKRVQSSISGDGWFFDNEFKHTGVRGVLSAFALFVLFGIAHAVVMGVFLALWGWFFIEYRNEHGEWGFE